MKKNIVLLLATVCTVLLMQGEESVTLQFVEKYSPSFNTSYANSSILPKQERLSSNAGDLNATYDENMPDSIITCINAALDIWSSKIGTSVPIYFEFRYQDLGENDIVSTIKYDEHEGKWIPSSLKATLTDNSARDSITPDAIIQINNSIDWDCSFGENQAFEKYNLSVGLLRAISRAFGFGSSIKTDRRGNLSFGVQDRYTDFDELIFSSKGTWLKNLSEDQLPNFVAPTDGMDIYALKQSPQYKMYAPPTYEQYRSLVYLDNKESLMHYDLGIGNRYLTVDDVTSEILGALGWNVRDNTSVKIVGNGIGENGIASAYSSHSFSIEREGGSGTIQNPHWEYSLPLKGGNYTVVKTGNTLNFEIPAIDDETKYEININGDIYGRITFTGMLNGKEVIDNYRISLELKPYIMNVEITKIENNTLYDSYNAYYAVEYRGADEITVSVEMEYGTKVPTWYIKEPFRATGIVDHIASPFYAWIDFTVENNYGKDVATIELGPNGTVLNKSKVAAIQKRSNNECHHINIYDIYGNFIAKVKSLSNLQNLQSGIYILKYYNKDNYCYQTLKHLVK